MASETAQSQSAHRGPPPSAAALPLIPRRYHKAMPPDQRAQLHARDVDFAVPLMREVLRALEEGFASYTAAAPAPSLATNDASGAEVAAADAAHQERLAAYEATISRFSDVAQTFGGYRIDWALLEEISRVVYPLVCCPLLARRTTSIWYTLAGSLATLYNSKRAHDVPPFCIPWRPLCDLVLDVIGEPTLQAVCPSGSRDTALFGKDTLNSLVEACCRYFDDNALVGIWGHLKPRLQRRNGEFYLGLFCGLLPVHRCCNTEAQREVAREVLDTLFDWSEGRYNYLFGFGFQTCDILYYFVSKWNIGLLDVGSYAERIFTLNLRMSGLRSDFATTTHSGFGVPQFQVGVGCAAYFSPESLGNFKNTTIAAAIAFALPDDHTSGLWNQLRRFLRACETYTCSSSANTRQSKAVSEWIGRFTAVFVDRVREQRRGLYTIPPSHVLSEATIGVFVSLLQQHVTERLYRTRGDATELIRLVALCPSAMLPSLERLVSQGAASGSQTLFPQVALGVIGLLANQSLYFDGLGGGGGDGGGDAAVRASLKALIISQRDWVLDCLEDPNGPTFAAACSALTGIATAMPMGRLYDDETAAALRVTKSLMKLTTGGGRPEHIGAASIVLLYVYRACGPATLEAVADFVVGEIKDTVSTTASERIFLSSLSTYAPEAVLSRYFPLMEAVLTNPRSTLQELKTHVEFFGALSLGPHAVAAAYAPRLIACIRSLLTHITSAEVIVLTGRLLHTVVSALILPRPRTNAIGGSGSNRGGEGEEELTEDGFFRVLDTSKGTAEGGPIKWLLPTDEGRLMAVRAFTDLALWTMGLLADVPAAAVSLKAAREALGVPLFDHEEAFAESSVRRGLTRFLQLCAGDAGRLLFTAASAIRTSRLRVAEVTEDPAAVLAEMAGAMHPSNYVFPSGVGGAFDPDAPATAALEELLAKADSIVLTDAFLRAAAESEAADDAICTQIAISGVHMLHGINFSSGKSLREFAKGFASDPAGISRRRTAMYYVAIAKAAADEVAAFMQRDELAGERRTRLLASIEHFTNSPFVRVAKSAQDVLLLHVRHMRVAECLPFIERICQKNADFISAPNDITANAIAEKNLLNSMVVASSLCAASTPSAVRILISPFVNNQIQLRCRPSVETTLERILGDVLSKLSRSLRTADSDWLLDAIFRVMRGSFPMPPQKKLMFLNQLSVLRLRRTDDAFVRRMVRLSLELMPLLHSRDHSIAVGTLRALADVTHSLFSCRLRCTVVCQATDTAKQLKADGDDASPVVVLSPAAFRQRLVAATDLRTLGTIAVPTEFCEYTPLKLANVEVAEAEACEEESDNAEGAIVDGVGGGCSSGSSNPTSSPIHHPHRWPLRRWRDWFASVLRRLSVGDCGNSYRTLTLFVTRYAMLANFKIAAPVLDACRDVFTEYAAEADSTRKRESGAMVGAFAVSRSLEELLRVELARFRDEEKEEKEVSQKKESGNASQRRTISEVGTAPADRAAFCQMLETAISQCQTFAEDVVLYVCESPNITTETFYEFASISPLDSDPLRSRMVAALTARIKQGAAASGAGALTSPNAFSSPTAECSQPCGASPHSPTMAEMQAAESKDGDLLRSSLLQQQQQQQQQCPTAASSSASSARSLFRYFCFLVSFSSSNTYEGRGVLATAGASMAFLEQHMGLVVREASRSSAIAQQLVDQIGHFVSRNVHFGLTWGSDAWPEDAEMSGGAARSEAFVRRLMAHSISLMERRRAAAAKATVAATLTPEDDDADVAAEANSTAVGGVASPTTDGVEEGAGNGAAAPDEDISIADGDTCKFEALLVIRVLSLSMSVLVQRLLPDIISWLFHAQLWVSDDAALADRILSLSRNIVSRDLSKVAAQAAVTQMCDLLIEVAAQNGAAADELANELISADAEAERDEESDNAAASSVGAILLSPTDHRIAASASGSHGDGGDLFSPQPQMLSPPLASFADMLSPLPHTAAGGATTSANNATATQHHHHANSSAHSGRHAVGGDSPPPPIISVTTAPSHGVLSPTVGGGGQSSLQPPAAAGLIPSSPLPLQLPPPVSLCSSLSSTRRVVLMLTAMLHRTLFLNLHRIGKFSMLQRYAEAVSASLGGLSHTSKFDHKMVAKNAIAVLVRVSSDVQVSALINPHLEVIRKAQATEGGLVAIARAEHAAAASLSSPTMAGVGGIASPAGGSAHMGQLKAVKKAVHFLCAVVLAYPEQVPPFCGKLLKALAPYGTAPVAEIRNAVGQMFKQWWRTHRERWEYEFKDQFTPAQQTIVLEYWSSSSYYA